MKYLDYIRYAVDVEIRGSYNFKLLITNFCFISIECSHYDFYISVQDSYLGTVIKVYTHMS